MIQCCPTVEAASQCRGCRRWFSYPAGGAMQREIRLTPILLLVLGLTTVLVVGLILLLWTFLPPNLQSGLPFAISTVVIVNTALLRVIPGVGKRLIGSDSSSAALANAQPQYAPPLQHLAHQQRHHAVVA